MIESDAAAAFVSGCIMGALRTIPLRQPFVAEPFEGRWDTAKVTLASGIELLITVKAVTS